jgi:hypothetical protein
VREKDGALVCWPRPPVSAQPPAKPSVYDATLAESGQAVAEITTNELLQILALKTERHLFERVALSTDICEGRGRDRICMRRVRLVQGADLIRFRRTSMA